MDNLTCQPLFLNVAFLQHLNVAGKQRLLSLLLIIISLLL